MCSVALGSRSGQLSMRIALGKAAARVSFEHGTFGGIYLGAFNLETVESARFTRRYGSSKRVALSHELRKCYRPGFKVSS
jgi:hypothetical protein